MKKQSKVYIDDEEEKDNLIERYTDPELLKIISRWSNKPDMKIMKN